MVGALLLSALLAQAGPVDLRVLVFVTTDCPISNRYAPEIQRLAAKFQRQAKFVLVYPVPTDSAEMIREHAQKFAYSLETLRDADQQLVKRAGVTVTPEVAVMSGTRVLYRGRIDDRYIDFGKDRLKPTRHDLDEALAALIAGKPVAQRETRAVGCIISDLLR